MKRTLTTILMSVFLFTGLSAQIVDRLVRRVERAAEDKAVEKIGKRLEEKTGEVMGEVYDMGDDSTQVRVDGDRVIVTGENGDEIEFSADKEPASTALRASSFIGSFEMESREYKGDKLQKGSPAQMKYVIDAYKIAIQMQGDDPREETIVIVDRQTRKMTSKVTDKDGNKTATIMPMLRIKAKVKSADVAADDFSITETGRTKTIEGMLCKEYLVESKNETSNVWVTEEWDFDFTVLLDFAQVKNASTGQMTNWSNVYGIKGMVIEGRVEKKNSNQVQEFAIRNIRNGAQPEVFSTQGYEVSDMGNMFGDR